jgi:hypothetical protein
MSIIEIKAMAFDFLVKKNNSTDLTVDAEATLIEFVTLLCNSIDKRPFND